MESPATTAQMTGAVVLVLALLGAIWAFRKSFSENRVVKEKFTGRVKESLGDEDTWIDDSAKTSTTTSAADNPWHERRQRGIAAVSTNKSDVQGDKPFGSKYYYAHNNTKATGGYKDGLRMEDYTMNGPRLLSRGGASVTKKGGVASETSAAADDFSGSTAADEEKKEPLRASSKKKSSDQSKPTLLISKYLWDDSGDSKGIATIRIDQLPCKNTSETIPWKDVKVLDATAVLEGEGLAVTIKTESEVDYALRFAKLYGEVEEVTVKTTKRLIIRLKKKERAGKGNLHAWPQPHKKADVFHS